MIIKSLIKSFNWIAIVKNGLTWLAIYEMKQD